MITGPRLVLETPHKSLVVGLQKMMVSALSNVAKVACFVMVCVDCRPSIIKG